jgi:hypothetical protein
LAKQSGNAVTRKASRIDESTFAPPETLIPVTGATRGYSISRRGFNFALPLDGFWLVVAAITAAQAALLGVLLSRGWFYGDDLPYQSEATGQRLGWHYLASSLNDHFIPGARLAFWLLNRTVGLDHGATVVLRVLLQLAATLLLARLLVLVSGRRPGVLLVLGWYGFGQLLLPGTLWLATAVCLLPAQLLLILALDLHVRYARSGRVIAGLGAALCLLGAVCFWELSLLYLLLLPILSLAFIHTGGLGQRLRSTLRRWPGWLALAVVATAWVVAFAVGPYGGSATAPRLGADAHELWTGWIAAVAPASVGGPWRWFAIGNVYFPITNPDLALRILAQAVAVAVLLAAAFRTRWRALAAWSMPVVVFVLSTVVIAVGRYRVFGDLTPRSLNYSFPLAVPMALALSLSLVRNPRNTPRPSSARRTGRRRLGAVLVAVACVGLLISNLVSAATFSSRWSQNPSKRYVANVTAAVRAAGPSLNLWNTRVPSSVLAAFSDHNHVADVLALAGVPARFQQPESAPELVTDDGSIVPAALYGISRGAQRKGSVCTALVQRAGSWTIPLSTKLGVNEYFIQISYLQDVSTPLYVSGIDSSGHVVTPVGGSRRVLPDKLANLYLQLPLASLSKLTVRSETSDASVCIGAVVVGVPIRAAG